MSDEHLSSNKSKSTSLTFSSPSSSESIRIETSTKSSGTIQLVEEKDERDKMIENCMLNRSLKQSVLLNDIISTEKVEPETDEFRNIVKTYKHMKKRIIGRQSGLVFSNKKKSFSYITFIFLLIVFLFYTLIATVWLDRGTDYLMEYLVFGTLSVIISFSVQYVSNLFHIILVEFTLISYAFFLIPSSYIYYSIYIGSVLLIFAATAIIYFGYEEIKSLITAALGINLIRSVNRVTTVQGLVQYQIDDNASNMTLEGNITDGAAEGYCTWLDPSEQGEFLRGIWKNGIPIGPFVTTENNSRTVMQNLRILYASIADGALWNKRKNPVVGVMGVESIISGSYYSGYPKCDIVRDEEGCSCEGECNCFDKVLKSGHYCHQPEKDFKTTIEVTVDNNRKALNSTGYRTLEDGKEIVVTVDRTQHQVRLELDSLWTPLAVAAENEGLIYIHSRNMSLENSICKFGQLLALGHFPRHVIPISSAMTENMFLHNDFEWLLRSLRSAQFKRIHVLCHGLGGKFFMKSFQTIQHLFSNHNSIDDGLMNFVNLVMLNCDYGLDDFLNEYNQVAQIVQRTTIYADRRDKKLFVSGWKKKKYNLGRIVCPLYDVDTGKPLERVEVIDTGDLERNYTITNKGFFDVDKMMVDDLFELISQGKGASYRSSHLLCEKDNQFRFSLLPGSVTMV
ncbi:Uncharacterized protein QTN25_003349 [Entamoeba marina]